MSSAHETKKYKAGWTDKLTKERYEEYLDDYFNGKVYKEGDEYKDNYEYDGSNPSHVRDMVMTVHRHFNDHLCNHTSQELTEDDFTNFIENDYHYNISFFSSPHLFECREGGCPGWFYTDNRCIGCGSKKYLDVSYVDWSDLDEFNLDSDEPVGDAENM